MKNQYFGDLNDYRKYGLLRILSGFGEISIAVCWMLTADDNTNHGGSIHYLDMPKVWRSYDPELFDILRVRVWIEGQRDLEIIGDESIITNAYFHLQFVPDNPNSRTEYIAEFLEKARDSSLIFFDPDNGFEVKSTSYRRKGSCRYLYWKEVNKAFDKDHSVLVYQHFPRENRATFIRRTGGQLLGRTGAKHVYTFETATVAYFLVPSRRHTTYFLYKSLEVEKKWSGQIILRRDSVMDLPRWH